MVARKTAVKKTSVKKSSVPARSKSVVRMITSVDAPIGKDTTVYFSDGTHATVKKDNPLSQMLGNPESVAPHLIQVTISGKNIVAAEPVVLDAPVSEE